MSHPTLFLENPWHPAQPALIVARLMGLMIDQARELNRKVSLLALSFFVVLSVADLVITKILLQQSGGAIYEANPLADLIIQNLGWGALTFFKFGMVSMVSAIVIYVAYYQPKTARRLLLFGCMLMTGVVGYSLCLMSYFT